MIEGLKIDISTAELRNHFEERAKYHRKKADWYHSQIKSLREGGVAPTRMSNDPVGSLEHSASHHVTKTAYFTFMAEHLIPDEIYRLTEDDLGHIELASKYYPGVRF